MYLEDEQRAVSQQVAQMKGQDVRATRTAASALPLVPHSQYREEGAIWSLLGYKAEGYFIEVGGYDGVSFSGSFFFEGVGWSGLLVEADPDLFEKCLAARPGCRVVNAAVGAPGSAGTVTLSRVSGAQNADALSYVNATARHQKRVVDEGGTVVPVQVPFTTLDAILQRDPPSSVDFVILDVEGMEADVLLGLNLQKWRPSVIMVERNDVDSAGSYAASRVLNSEGYVLARMSSGNDIFVRRDLAPESLLQS